MTEDVFFDEALSIKIHYIIISLIIGAGFTYLYKLKYEQREQREQKEQTTTKSVIKYIFICLLASFVSLLFMTSFSGNSAGISGDISKKLNAKEMHTGEPNF